MGLFSFFKNRNDQKKLNSFIDKINRENYPQGQKDIDAGTDMLLQILSHNISREEAQKIFMKAFAISRISQNFDEERLRFHLKGYCIDHFNDSEINSFFDYLLALKSAKILHGRTPADVKRNGESYYW